MKHTLSLCLIVKDEAGYLDRCLASYRPVADEIIVVDTGSSDNSCEIAKSHGAKVFETPWEGDFAKARNLSLDHAAKDWIIWTDADDLIDATAQAKIKTILTTRKPDCCFGFMIKNTQDGVLGSVFNQIRMFPNHKQARFRYRVHEQVLPSLQELGFRPFFTDVMVMHTGYSTPEIVKQKQVRNLAIMEKEIIERPDNPVVVYSYAGNLVDLERWQEAIPYYEKAMRLSREQKREEHIALGAPVALASLYGRLKDYANSRKWADEAYLSDPKNVQLHSILGELCEIEGKMDDAVRWYESVLSFEEAPVFIPVDFNMLKINACTKLGRLYMQKGDQRRAIEYLDRALKICRK